MIGPALDIATVVVAVSMMLAVGLELRPRDVATTLSAGRTPYLAGLICQSLLVPAIGVICTRTPGLSSSAAAGLLLLAACPVGDIANFYTLLARGNLALSVLLNASSCVLAAGTMGIILGVFGRVHADNALPSASVGRIALRVALLSAVPLVVAVLAQRLPRPAAKTFATGLKWITILGIVVSMTLVAVSQRSRLADEWRASAAASGLFILICMAGGWLVAGLFRLPRGDRLTLTMVFPVRNIALASAVAVTVLGRVEYAAFALVYFIVEVPILMATALSARAAGRQSESTQSPDDRHA